MGETLYRARWLQPLCAHFLQKETLTLPSLRRLSRRRPRGGGVPDSGDSAQWLKPLDGEQGPDRLFHHAGIRPSTFNMLTKTLKKAGNLHALN